MSLGPDEYVCICMYVYECVCAVLCVCVCVRMYLFNDERGAQRLPGKLERVRSSQRYATIERNEHPKREVL